MSLFLDRLYQIKTGYLYLGFILLSLIFNILITQKLINSEILYNVYEHMSYEEVSDVIESMGNRDWKTYLIFPLIVLLRLTIASCFIHMIVTLMNSELKFKKVFNINLIGSLSTLIISFVLCLKLYLMNDEAITADNFYLNNFALSNLFNEETTAYPLFFFMEKISVVEGLYVVLVGFGIANVGSYTLKKSMGLSIIIWLIFTGFYTALFSFLKLSMQ